MNHQGVPATSTPPQEPRHSIGRMIGAAIGGLSIGLALGLLTGMLVGVLAFAVLMFVKRFGNGKVLGGIVLAGTLVGGLGHLLLVSSPSTPTANTIPTQREQPPEGTSPSASALLVQETQAMSAQDIVADLVYLRSLAYCNNVGKPDPRVLTYLYQFKTDPNYKETLKTLEQALSTGKSLCSAGMPQSRPSVANVSVVSRSPGQLVVDYDFVLNKVKQRYEAKLYWSSPLWYATSISAI